MIRIDQLKIKISENAPDLKETVAKRLRIKQADVTTVKIIKRSIDARKKPDLYFVYSVCADVSNEKKVLNSFSRDKDVSVYEPVIYMLPENGDEKLTDCPVIVGAGPAGLFCAYELALEGYKPLVVERGRRVEDRRADIEKFWKTGVLDPSSNVQFGEGGAGTFSDGKLTTSIKDRSGRIGEVLGIFVKHGAEESILYENMPHIGTDRLRDIIVRLRHSIEEMGGKVIFETVLTGIKAVSGRITGCRLKGPDGSEYEISCSELILATGHSARDTYRMLYDSGVVMEQKPFAAGLRVIHPQKMIDNAQYGDASYAGILGAAPYKLTAESEGRGVFSFCMCPGGYVVNSSSEVCGTVVNGMSNSKRDSGYANSAIVVSIPVSDYPDDHPLSGILFQEDLEKRTFDLCKGKMPLQRLGDFKEKSGIGSLNKSGEDYFENFDESGGIRGKYEFSDLSGIFNSMVNHAFVNGMERFGRVIPGFDDDRVILAGVESRTSSPVRITRDDEMYSNIKGLMPIGEGAGYAGGITSAAIDGIKAAEQIIKKYKSFE